VRVVATETIEARETLWRGQFEAAAARSAQESDAKVAAAVAAATGQMHAQLSAATEAYSRLQASFERLQVGASSGEGRAEAAGCRWVLVLERAGQRVLAAGGF
jgi:hypothetical protein